MPASFDAEYSQGLKEYALAVDKGDAQLLSMGFPPAERPRGLDGNFSERPYIPPNLSDCSMADLQNLLGQLTAWHSYAIEHLPHAVSERNAAESARDFAWAKIRQAKDGRVADKDDSTRTDARYVQANSYYETCDFKSRKLKAICDGIHREIETISRAIAALDQRYNVGSAQVSGEGKGYRAGSGPSGRNNGPPRLDVMSRFRAGRMNTP